MDEFRVGNGATELLLIRHGAAEHPEHGLSLEPKEIDMPLSAHGQQQASLLAERLAKRGIAALYTSPLPRCAQTAAIIAEQTGHIATEDPRLREVEIAGVGPVTLHDLAEIALAHGGWSHIEGTESSQSIRTRMRDALDAIVTQHPASRVAVVSHAGVINAYISLLLGLPRDFFFPAGNTSISIVRAREKRRLLVTLNDIAHLEIGR